MKDKEDCDTNLLHTFLKRVISLRRYPAADNRSIETDAGIVRKSLVQPIRIQVYRFYHEMEVSM